jgi:D-hydroxyproline dehydrogenase subunit beta
VIGELPGFLAREFGVAFHFATTVTHCGGRLMTTAGEFAAPRVVVCTGDDFRDLAPAAFAESGLVRCKLQMMRTADWGGRFRLGTMLAAGLTLIHYKSFAHCPTLPAVAARLDAEDIRYARYGIHVMASQNATGEVTLGDSHEYGDDVSPFDDPQIDRLILEYLGRFVKLPDLSPASRWHGLYVKHPTEPWVVARPAADVLAITGVGGAGMTLSFGLAERTVANFLGDHP